PSFYEGFGLPLLEAMHCGAPVLAGRNSSQQEVVGEAGLLADAASPAEIGAQLARLLSDSELGESLRRRGPEQARKFSWEATADRAIAALEETVRDRTRPRRAFRATAPRRRIAFFSPLPPKRSGIADYSQSLLEHLREHYVIDLYHASGYVPHLSLSSLDFACHDFRLFPRYRRALGYRGLVYQMGNSKYHGFVYQTLLKYPGVVALHDFSLAGFHHWYALQADAAPDHFARQLAGEDPALAAEYLAERERWAAEPGGIPAACNRRGARLNGEVLEIAESVVVHDVWVAQQIRDRHPELAERVCVVPHGADAARCAADRRRQLRRQFAIAADALLLGCFGILHSTKCNVETIEAFAAIAGRHPTAQLAFAGRDLGGGEAQAKVAALGLADRVRFFGHLSIDAFRELAAITDIGVNLRRPPTNGETSGALVMLLGAGVPTVVIDVDTFASYPDDVVRKVTWDSDLVSKLVATFDELAAAPLERARMSEAALRHIRDRHGWSRSAGLYMEAIEAAYQRRQSYRRAPGEMGAAFHGEKAA
ncbi:MAG TPA: glycosyltransferase, partial [Pirellulales bacterium]|nr:glycosyltransferase [Pirellulales bacterium]